MGNDVQLVGFDLNNETIVAVCRRGKRKARVTLDSVEFPELTPAETSWGSASLSRHVPDPLPPRKMSSRNAYKRIPISLP